jgi:hydroxyacylglutathione hydrolase
VDEGAQLLDTREPVDYEGAHVRGAINIGLGGSFATWCGTLLETDRPVVLIAEPGRELEAATRLGRIGFDSVAGYVAGGMEQLGDAPELIERTTRLTAPALAEQLASSEPPQVIDVRTEREWQEGRIDGALSMPLSRLSEQISGLPRDREVVTYCASGYRSAIANSVLSREGLRTADLVGGLAAWESARLAVAGR